MVDTKENCYAAIDLGSNSFHMVVAEPEGDSIRVIDSLRIPVRLGSGLDSNKRLKDETEELALDAIGQFAQRLKGIPPSNIRIVGTNTLRRARNTDRFHAESFKLLGKKIETISGREEARLIYSAVAHGLPAPATKRLVIDIGGGSTELITGQSFKPELMESLNIGCVSFTTKFFDDDKLAEKTLKKSIVRAQLELQPIVKAYRDSNWDEVIGCSGTIKATRNVLMELGLSDGLITRDALKELLKMMAQAGALAKMNLSSISRDRTIVFAGGLVILYAIMKTLKLKELQASQVALREGLIFGLIGKSEHSDIQTETISNLIARHHIDELQAGRVKSLALNLLTIVGASWNVESEEDVNLLSWAATLHEIGLSVSHSQYHKHGAYLIENSDLLGFSRAEQSALALLVRFHRRKLDINSFKNLPGSEHDQLLRLAIILRIAVLLRRARYIEDLGILEFNVKKNALELRAPAHWFDTHPLTTADLHDESVHLAPSEIKLTITDIEPGCSSKSWLPTSPASN